VLAAFLNAGGGAAGLGALHSEIFEELCKVKTFPCMGTCRSYIHQWMNKGNNLAKLHTGNKFVQWEIHGDNLFYLVLYQIAFPKANCIPQSNWSGGSGIHLQSQPKSCEGTLSFPAFV
jgi:hypothetical protein